MVMALDKMPALSDYGTIIAQFLPFVVLIVVFYFFLIRPQRKRDKQERDMRTVSYTHLDVYKRQGRYHAGGLSAVC